MWARSKESGKTMAETFLTNGLPIIQAPRDGVQGHMAMKHMMSQMPLKDKYVKSLFPEGKAPATLPGLMLFSDLTKVAADLRDIQTDEKNVNDCAKEPHEITHTVDAVRYFCVSRTTGAVDPVAPKKRTFEDMLDEKEENYDSYMCGGEPTESYLAG